jgi:hypothetical protein
LVLFIFIVGFFFVVVGLFVFCLLPRKIHHQEFIHITKTN